MGDGKVVRAVRITPEEAQAFRERVREQNERMANMVVIDIDDFIELVEEKYPIREA